MVDKKYRTLRSELLAAGYTNVDSIIAQMAQAIADGTLPPWGDRCPHCGVDKCSKRCYFD